MFKERLFKNITKQLHTTYLFSIHNNLLSFRKTQFCTVLQKSFAIVCKKYN